MKVLNFLAGPGAGKSTTAWGLAHLMKSESMSVELIHEYAKEVVWEERLRMLDNQLYLFAKQEKMQRQLIDKVDFCITDSPLILQLAYVDLIKLRKSGAEKRALNSLAGLIKDYNSTYDNFYVYINRMKSYVDSGRTQTEQEAKTLDQEILSILKDNKLPYVRVDGDKEAPAKILEMIR